MNLTTLGIDLAKTSFSLVGMDERGKVILHKTLKRDSLLPFIAQCPQCLIGMEACSGAHYPNLFKNARQFAAWIGLVPRQHTTGGHVRYGRSSPNRKITK